MDAASSVSDKTPFAGPGLPPRSAYSLLPLCSYRFDFPGSEGTRLEPPRSSAITNAHLTCQELLMGMISC